MKKIKFARGFALTIAALFISLMLSAQGDKASRPSPAATASGQINGATITITYSSPSVKGRQIWGSLVPYEKVWRAGANEATIFETSKDIKVEGKPLPAGKYSLYAIPGEKEWMIIFNSQTGQWGIKRTGETTREEGKDVLSVKAKLGKSSGINERLAYEVTSSGFVMRWENIEVPVSIN